MNKKISSIKSSEELISEDQNKESLKNKNSKRSETKVKKFKTDEGIETKSFLIGKKNNKSTGRKRVNVPSERILIDFEENKNSRNVKTKKKFLMTVKSFFKQKILPESKIFPETSKIITFKNSNEKPSINMNRCLICNEKLNDKEKEDNLLPCMHMICDGCYFSYLKEKKEIENLKQNYMMNLFRKNYIEILN